LNDLPPVGAPLAKARTRLATCLGPAEATPGAAGPEGGMVLRLGFENRHGVLVLAESSVARPGPPGEAVARCCQQTVLGLSVPIRFPGNDLSNSHFRMRLGVGP